MSRAFTLLAFLLLTPSSFAMDSSSAIVPLSVVGEESATLDELRGYIRRGSNLKEGLEDVVLDNFNDFVAGLENDNFTGEKKKSVKNFQQAKNDFETLKESYIGSVSGFYNAFSTNVAADAFSSVPLIGENLVIKQNMETTYPKHAPYFRTFQKLSNQFLDIHTRYSKTPLSPSFDIIPGEGNLNVGVFKDAGGYVPFPITSRLACEPVAIFYGGSISPQKQFIFSNGALIKDSGLLINPRPENLQFRTQYGEHAAHPFTVNRVTYRASYDNEKLLMQALKEQFGETLTTESHFISLPATQEESDILELLFLEDLQEAKKNNPSTLLTYIESEAEGSLAIEGRLKQEEEKFIQTYQARLEQEACQAVAQGNQEISTVEPKKQKKQPKQKKKGQGKKPNKNYKKNPSKEKQAEQETPSVDYTAQARALLAKIKQEGRVKFRRILGIMNTIRANAPDNKIFDKFVSVSRSGSHINFHMEEGKGVSLIKKHGQEDLTYPADVVNNLSARLVKAIFLSSSSSE